MRVLEGNRKIRWVELELVNFEMSLELRAAEREETEFEAEGS